MEIESLKIRVKEYVWDVLYRHDLDASRNENNDKRMQKIVERCVKEIEDNTQLAESIKCENQIEYFVRQTILLMV